MPITNHYVTLNHMIINEKPLNNTKPYGKRYANQPILGDMLSTNFVLVLQKIEVCLLLGNTMIPNIDINAN